MDESSSKCTTQRRKPIIHRTRNRITVILLSAIALALIIGSVFALFKYFDSERIKKENKQSDETCSQIIVLLNQSQYQEASKLVLGFDERAFERCQSKIVHEYTKLATALFSQYREFEAITQAKGLQEFAKTTKINVIPESKLGGDILSFVVSMDKYSKYIVLSKIVADSPEYEYVSGNGSDFQTIVSLMTIDPNRCIPHINNIFDKLDSESFEKYGKENYGVKELEHVRFEMLKGYAGLEQSIEKRDNEGIYSSLEVLVGALEIVGGLLEELDENSKEIANEIAAFSLAHPTLKTNSPL